MARYLRVAYAGAVYHVTARGNDRSKIFHTEADRTHLLALLGEMMDRYEVVLHGYVLMENHYHLIVRTLRPNLSRFMHDVNTGFCVWTNRRNRRTGHVFEGRFKAIVMQEEGYLRAVSAYVHLNPVRTKAWQERPVGERLKRVATYPWSSYRDYSQRVAADRRPRVTCASVWGDLGARTEREGRRLYREYVHGWLVKDRASPLAAVKRGCYLGEGAFGDWLERLLVGDQPLSEEVVGQREWAPAPVPVAAMLERIAGVWGTSLEAIRARGRPNEARDVAIYLCRAAGARALREIGSALGIKGSAVSLATARVRQRMLQECGFEKRVEAARVAVVKLSKT